jgi:hypothetical protein
MDFYFSEAVRRLTLQPQVHLLLRPLDQRRLAVSLNLE